jgi:hypothetical protein
MKKILPLSLVCLILFSFVAGCATAPAVVPASFVGTKWVQVISFMGERNTLEFINETTCIYTFYGEPQSRTYKVRGNNLILDGSGTYTIQGDTLLLRGNPYWAKE